MTRNMKSTKINSEDTTLQIVDCCAETEEQADMQKQKRKRQDNKIPQYHAGLSFCYGQIHAAQLQ